MSARATGSIVFFVCCFLLLAAGCSDPPQQETAKRGDVGSRIQKAVDMSVTTEASDVPANRPPVIRSVDLTPKTLIPGMGIRVDVQAVDSDGDPVTFEYEWERNGEILLGEWSETLATKGFNKGDSIRVKVTPSDGKTQGESVFSESASIGNRPPEILSLPPHELKDGKFIYSVEAIDPDEDELVFALENAPPGMIINAESGLVEWSVPEESDAEFPLKIKVTDGEETFFQEFTITVSPNRPEGRIAPL